MSEPIIEKSAFLKHIGIKLPSYRLADEIWSDCPMPVNAVTPTIVKISTNIEQADTGHRLPWKNSVPNDTLFQEKRETVTT